MCGFLCCSLHVYLVKSQMDEHIYLPASVSQHVSTQTPAKKKHITLPSLHPEELPIAFENVISVA